MSTPTIELAAPSQAGVTNHDDARIHGAGSESALPARWRGILAVLDTPAGDGRIIQTPPGGAARVRPMPLPLMYQETTGAGHQGAYVIGSLDRAWLQSGRHATELWGEGSFDTSDERAAGMIRRIADGWQPWISIRVDDQTEALACRVDGLTIDCAEAEVCTTDAGAVRQHPALTDWRLMNAVVLPEPAFADARIVWTGAASEPVEPVEGIESGDAAADTTFAARDSIGFAPRDTSWDGSAARDSLQAWARGDDGEINWSKYGRGFLYVRPADDGGHKLSDFKLPYAKVVDGKLVAVFAGLAAAAAAVSGARGGVDIPSSALGGVKRRINALYARARSQFDDPDIQSPLERSEHALTVLESGSDVGAGITFAAAPPDPDLVQLQTSSGQQWRPPHHWFTDPGLDEYTRLTITSDGHVYGHIADWRAAHISYHNKRVAPPPSKTGYRWFHRRALETDSGDIVRVGQLTFGPGHAGPAGDRRAAIHHYDATCAQGAVVHAGEDAHGIWIAGAILPHLTVPERNQLALADTSGDWRSDRGHLELVAAHCVGVPGFLSSRDAEGSAVALTAAAYDGRATPIVRFDAAGDIWSMVAVGSSDTADVLDRDEETADDVVVPQAEPGAVSDDADEDVGAADPMLPQQDDQVTPGAEVSDQEESPPADSSSDHEDVRQAGGHETRVLDARRRMALVRREASQQRYGHVPDQQEHECRSAGRLEADIAALTAAMDLSDPDVLHARELAARIRRHGLSGSLTAASGSSLDRKPGTNWVEDDPQGLPPLIRRVARHIENNGRPLSVAIPAAINWVKHICSTGDVENWPGIQDVNPTSQAAACRAVSQWNALKARN